MNVRGIGLLAPVLALSACSSSVAPDRAKAEPTYLLSVIDLPITADESVESFHFDTWGVTFHKICKFPNSWSIEAGVGATPQGVFGGEGSVGASWIAQPNDPDLQNLALVSFWGPATQEGIQSYKGTPEIPAWFAGTAKISGLDDEIVQPLSGRNIRIVPAKDCPSG